MKFSTRIIAAIAAIGTATVLGGCATTPASPGTTPTNQAAEVVNVRYLTSFNTFGREAYVYVAKEKGYFKDANLTVDVTPGTGSVDVMKLIAGGQADIGIADFSALAITQASQHLDLTAVAAIYQSPITGVVALKSSGINSAADMVGKSFGDQPGSTNQLLFPVWAKASGIDPSTVTFVPSPPPTLPQLLAAKKVDFIGQLAVGLPLIQKAVGDSDTAVFIPYSDKFPDFYGNMVVVSNSFLKAHPEAVKSFVAALLKGLEYSVNNPEETADILVKAQPTQDGKVAAAEVVIMKKYVGASADIGRMTQARVESTIKTLADAGAFTGASPTAADMATFDLLK